VTYTALGVAAALLGSVLQNMGKWWYLFLGVLMVLMALQTWEIFNFIPSAHLTGKAKKKGFLGAFLAGILGGVFASPCATPVLVVLLGVVAKGGNVAWGVLLLLLYSLGNSTLIVLVGTFVGFVKKLKENPKYGVFSNILKYASGGVILLIGLYMFYLGF
ncbi:MAG: cytochrome c biogenesis protein CcdA, partial [Oscillospiraceae bacterium]